MLLLLDGYNILKYRLEGVHILQEQRSAFLKKVAHYALAKKHQVIVVFDAGEFRHVTHDKEHGIHVIYSGQTKTADDVLKHLLLKHMGHAVLLVSSDRELVEYAQRCKITSLDADGFVKLLEHGYTEPVHKKTMASQGCAHKREGHESDEDVDALMEQASLRLVYKNDDFVTKDPSSRGNTLSKHEKKISKIIKKL